MSASKHRRKGKSRSRTNKKNASPSAGQDTTDRIKITDGDNLTLFFDMIQGNQLANRQNYAEPYSLMLRINDRFVTAQQALVDPKPVVLGIMCLRSQYAFKAAVGMSLAGQVGEAFAVMRLCLEYAGYALLIFAEPQLAQVFSNRHLDDASKRAQKQAFTITKVRESIAVFDSALADTFQKFYDRMIDLGAHPNPGGVYNMAKIEAPQPDESGGIIALALTIDELSLRHAMKNTSQVGLIALLIFGNIFKDKFESLGILAEIDELRRILL